MKKKVIFLDQKAVDTKKTNEKENRKKNTEENY